MAAQGKSGGAQLLQLREARMTPLELRDTHTGHGNIHALKGINITACARRDAIGANGAGKTTIIDFRHYAATRRGSSGYLKNTASIERMIL